MPVPIFTEIRDLPTAFGTGTNLSLRNSACGITTEMAFLEPTMQDFLAQSDFDLGLLNSVDMPSNDARASYF